MDLDDEELEATRRLNGVDKKDSIEKDIKRCEELIKPEHANWIGISNQLAIAHVVDRAKEVENDLTTAYLKGYADAEEKHKKRIKELEEEKKTILNSKIGIDLSYDDYIPKQKVKDKIEEINKEYEDSKDENGDSEYYYPDYTIRKLEELMEDK